MKLSKLTKTIFAVIIGLAGVSVIAQLLNGLCITGLKEPVNWGLYIVNFTLFLGLGAGSLIWMSGSWLRKDVAPMFRLYMSLASVASLVMAGIFIILDLGRIDRFYYMAIYGQLSSPLFIDFIILNGLLTLSLIYLFISLRQNVLTNNLKISGILGGIITKVVSIAPKFRLNPLLAKVMAAAIIFKVFVMYYLTTHVFSELATRPLWHAPMLPIVFFTSALLANVALVHWLASFTKESEPSSSLCNKAFPILLAVDTIAVFIKFIADHQTKMSIQHHGIVAGLFILAVTIGNIIPLIQLLKKGPKSAQVYRLVAYLVFAGLLLKRALVIVPAYLQRWLPFPDGAGYFPSVPEVLIVAGVYCGVVWAYTVFLTFLDHSTN